MLMLVLMSGAANLQSQELQWLNNRDDAMAAARSAGKWVVLLAGRDSCDSCYYMKTVVAESVEPPVKALITQYFVLWYSPIDNSTECLAYTDGLGTSWTLPLICVIDPAQPNKYVDRSVGIQMSATFYQRLLGHTGKINLLPSLAIERTPENTIFKIVQSGYDSRWKLQTIAHLPTAPSNNWADVSLSSFHPEDSCWVITNLPFVPVRLYRLLRETTPAPP